jgi:hypothetical protein
MWHIVTTVFQNSQGQWPKSKFLCCYSLKPSLERTVTREEGESEKNTVDCHSHILVKIATTTLIGPLTVLLLCMSEWTVINFSTTVHRNWIVTWYFSSFLVQKITMFILEKWKLVPLLVLRPNHRDISSRRWLSVQHLNPISWHILMDNTEVAKLCTVEKNVQR